MGLGNTTLTRVAAALSLLALLAVSLSDFLLTGFWDRNAMVTSVVADVLVLIVGVAVVNEFLSARAKRQWRLLADYALVELEEAARHIWVTLAQQLGVGRRESLTRDEFRALVHSREGKEATQKLVLHEDSLNWRPSFEGSGDADWIAARITGLIQFGSKLDLELVSEVKHPDRWGELRPDGDA